MAIESISGTPINRNLPANTASKDTTSVKPQTVAPSTADTIDFTNTSQDIKSAIASSTVAGQSAINQDRVTALKTAIQNGSYTVNAERVADKILKFEERLPNSS